MSGMRRTALTLALLLAACGQQEQQDPAPTPAPDTPAAAPTAATPGAGEDKAIDRDMASGRIPGRFHGVWDTESGTCDPASDTRITVTAARIEYYESVGDVTRVSAAGDDVILAIAMTGEGMA